MTSFGAVVLFAVAMAMPCSAEKKELFEGDIVMTDSVRRVVAGVGGYGAQVRGRWPGAVVPYTFHRYFGDAARRGLVLKAIRDFKDKTCVQFVPRTNQRDYVEFYKGSGCSSMIGVQGGRQQISIGDGCTSHGTIIHEMMHAIGFWHEQSRRDRNNYVTIHWNNIEKAMRYNFDAYLDGQATDLGKAYDMDSVMHYGNYDFSSNGRATITVNGNPQRILGQRNGFSTIDREQINLMYKCNGVASGCGDQNVKCAEWASKGECKKNPTYMLQNCKKSCNQCPDCNDKDQHCAYWASTNECSKNPAHMHVNCRLSCKLC